MSVEPPTNKRLLFLEQAVRSGSADSFAFYALALEYRKQGRTADALATFEALRAREPTYLPMFLMAGQMLLDDARKPEAAGWLEAGMVLAREQADQKALGELEAALADARE